MTKKQDKADEQFSEELEEKIAQSRAFADAIATINACYQEMSSALAELPDTHMRRLAREHLATGALWAAEAYRDAS